MENISKKAVLIDMGIIISDEQMKENHKDMLPIVEALCTSYNTMTTVWDGGKYRILPVELFDDLMCIYYKCSNKLKKINPEVKTVVKFLPIPNVSQFDSLLLDKKLIDTIKNTFNTTVAKQRQDSINETKKRFNSILAGIIRELKYSDEEPVMLQKIVNLAIDELPILNVFNDEDIMEKTKALDDMFRGCTDHILNKDKSKRDELLAKAKALNLEK